MRSLWYKPEGFFPWAEHVYVIGLSLCPDDFFVRSFLLMALSDWKRQITVINPDPAARGNYGFLPCDQVTYRLEGFSMSHVEEKRIVSDIHGTRTAFEAVVVDLGQTSPDIILHGGDLADSGSNPAEIVDQNTRSGLVRGWLAILMNCFGGPRRWRSSRISHPS